MEETEAVTEIADTPTRVVEPVTEVPTPQAWSDPFEYEEPGTWRYRLDRPLRWGIAAAALVVTASTAGWLGMNLMEGAKTHTAPPAATPTATAAPIEPPPPPPILTPADHDNLFLTQLKEKNINFGSREANIQEGHRVCFLLSGGMLPLDIADQMRDSSQMSGNQTGWIVGSAITAYCPEYAKEAAHPTTAAPTPAPAATDKDQKFLQILINAGDDITDRSNAIAGAHWICSYLGSGHTRQETINYLTGPPSNWDDSTSTQVDAAIEVYCPQST
jgi:hypothetical protein